MISNVPSIVKKGVFVRLHGLMKLCVLIPIFLLSGITLIGLSKDGRAADSPAGHVPQEVRRFHVDGYINAVAWNADGSRLATLSKFGSVITLFETKTWSVLKEFLRLGGGYSHNSLAFLLDNTLLTATPIGDYSKDPRYANTSLTDTHYNRLDIFSLINWNPETGQVVRYLPNVGYPPKDIPPHIGPTDTFTVSKDGSMIAGIGGNAVLLYDVNTGSLIRRLEIPPVPNHRDGAISVAFSPDGKELAVGTNSGMMHFFNTKTLGIAHSFPAYTSARPRVGVAEDDMYGCNAIAFSADGSLITVGKHKAFNVKDPNTIAGNIFRVSTGEMLASLQGSPVPIYDKYEASPVRTVSWGADGLLAVGDDQSLRLWQIGVTTQTLLLNVKINHGAFSTAISPQGILAATDNSDVVIYQ